MSTACSAAPENNQIFGEGFNPLLCCSHPLLCCSHLGREITGWALAEGSQLSFGCYPVVLLLRAPPGPLLQTVLRLKASPGEWPGVVCPSDFWRGAVGPWMCWQWQQSTFCPALAPWLKARLLQLLQSSSVSTHTAHEPSCTQSPTKKGTF